MKDVNGSVRDKEFEVLFEGLEKNTERPYEVVNHKVTKVGRFKVTQDSCLINGNVSPYSYIQMKKNVTVLTKVGDKFVIYKQYRHSINDYTLEIPAGTVDEDETKVDAATREIKEETGYNIINISYLGSSYSSCGSTTEESFMFFAECSDIKMETNREDLELIEVILVSEEELLNLILENKIKMAQGIIAYFMHREKIKNKETKAIKF